MAVSQVETPNGVIDIEHPEGTPESQLLEFAAASLGIQPVAQKAEPLEEPLDIADFPLASQKNMDNFSAMEKFTYEFAKAGSLTKPCGSWRSNYAIMGRHVCWRRAVRVVG